MFNFQCKNWVVTAIYFRGLPYIITNDKLMAKLYAKIKDKKLSKYKKTVALLLFRKVKMHKILPVYLCMLKSLLKQMQLNTVVTIYEDTFKFAHTINLKWHIMPY